MNRHTFTKTTKVSDFLRISEVIDKLDQDSLALFDVDDVLIMDQDEYRLTHPYRLEWRAESKNRLTREERQLFFSIILKNRTIRLVDPHINDILNKLWEKQIPTAALTKLYTGRFGVIEDFTDWRLKELKGINIDFMKSTPIKEEILIDGLHGKNGIPMMKEGVILTADIDKGAVLENILHNRNYYPKTIIFVDDVLENIESVEKICTKLQINFYGFEFNGASLVPEAELDKKSEKIRFEILEKEHRWVTDLKL
ncbi:DUF2608 domain-containing protein [Candidatus Tisiphia endosymbiont of Hybos culiciformis]|uniref:DUF2608 domain-containing protein n=1 Tax=Candidatus Tisiphia endosymbiont of Hybos culiciformis TaxID=3139331 RepID=UPI003CCAB1D0